MRCSCVTPSLELSGLSPWSALAAAAATTSPPLPPPPPSPLPPRLSRRRPRRRCLPASPAAAGGSEVAAPVRPPSCPVDAPRAAAPVPAVAPAAMKKQFNRMKQLANQTVGRFAVSIGSWHDTHIQHFARLSKERRLPKLTEREREHKLEGKGEGSQLSREPMWGLMPGTWDHDLSRSQMPNRVSYPGDPVISIEG